MFIILCGFVPWSLALLIAWAATRTTPRIQINQDAKSTDHVAIVGYQQGSALSGLLYLLIGDMGNVD